VIAVVVMLSKHTKVDDKYVVNVYGWHGIIPKSIIEDFEKETGLHVTYDVYDNNDTLESKLIATRSEYDVVFPSFIPYGARQANMLLFKELDYSKLPNINNISKSIKEKVLKSGGDSKYLIPFFWGTIGIAINKEIVYRLLPNVDVDSYDIVFNPENLKVLSKHGISFPEEFTDIYPQVMLYLGRDPRAKTQENLKAFTDYFKKIRKYISKFSSTTIINDLLCENICVGIGSSDCIRKAINVSKELNEDKIKYITPKGKDLLWVDCIAIPKSARHPENAYKFVNYLMKTEVCMKITEYCGINIKTNETEEKEIEKMIIGVPSKNENDLKFDKTATRAWSQIRSNNFRDN
jgi:putrescine transport system substrate-binding protein